ncbi:hypothetical protein ACFE04_010316 [Oxalis oulophora]
MIFQILFLLINFITLSLCDSDFDYTTCNNTFKCGDKDLGYPFWGGERPSSCGHPKLGLTCVDENTSLKMNNLTYRVIEVYEGYDYLQLARDDYLQGFCQPKYANTTIDHDLFQLDPSYANFVISYGCPSKNCTSQEQFQYCTAANGECRDVLVYQGSKKFLGDCESGVIVPLHNATITQDIQSVNEGLQDGFVVSTKVNNTMCVQCQRSFGFCAYDNSLNEPICYCSDQQLLSPGTNCSPPFMNPAGFPQDSDSSK